VPVSLTFADLHERRGQEIAVGDWLQVTQAQIDRFAEATGDRQWIHVDPDRAAASPWGGTIAHGFLTLSLLSPLLRRAVAVEPVSMAINCGLNRVRFVSPVKAGARIRGRFTPATVEDVEGGIQVAWAITIDLEGTAKPACIAEWIVRYLR
jgi:acyl dehydratase